MTPNAVLHTPPHKVKSSEVEQLEEIIRNLRARTEKQAEQITSLLAKVRRLEEENDQLHYELMDEMNRDDSYGGTD